MRILRIDIPDHFTPDFFESNIMSLHNIISKKLVVQGFVYQFLEIQQGNTDQFLMNVNF